MHVTWKQRCSLAGSLFVLATAAVAADIGRIKISTGPVHIERGGARLAAPVDTIVQSSDVLVTGPDAAVGVTFTDNTRMAAGPNSVVALSRYAFDQTTHAGTFDATVRRGTLGVISGRMTKQSPDAMTVRTPTMVMGVRGTEFLVYAGE